MLEKIKKIRSHPRFVQLTDVRNIGLYVFGILVLIVSYNTVGVIQLNYELQKKIARLQQQNDVRQLENSNMALRNKFLATDQYLELAARKYYGKASPGETLLLVPKEIAKKHAPPLPQQPDSSTVPEEEKNEPFYKRNLKAWWKFFFRDSS